MSENKTYRLSKDIHSNYADKKGNWILYGKKNETVTLISNHEDVMIVEAKNKKRFPVREEFLIEINNA